MKEILIGTTNPSKANYFAWLLSGYDLRFHTLKDLGITAEPEETGNTPEENAILKARFYGQFFDLVLCNDSGLYLDCLPLSDPRQPGLHVRTPGNGPRLDDEEMLRWYSTLAHSLGGQVLAYYLNGLAVWNRGRISSYTVTPEFARQDAFYLVDTPSPKRREGWPLDSISLYKDSMTYFVDAPSENTQNDQRTNVLFEKTRSSLVGFLVEALQLEENAERKI